MASAFDALDLEEPAEEAREAPASAADEPEPSSGAAFAALQDVEAAEEATAPEEDSEAGPAGEVLAALQIEQPEAAPAPKVQARLLQAVCHVLCHALMCSSLFAAAWPTTLLATAKVLSFNAERSL